MTSTLFTSDFLKQCLDYDAGTGLFVWRRRPVSHFANEQQCLAVNGQRAGRVAGRLNGMGYVIIGINRRGYRAHRLAWLYMTGDWPLHQIDHIDGNRANNVFANLRDIPCHGNLQNTKIQVNNTSGYPGVGFHRASGKWYAKITIHRCVKSLGLFESKEDAAQAYLDAKQTYHTYQPRPRHLIEASV